MSTDPKSVAANQAATASNFAVKAGLQQPGKYFKEDSKRTIVDGFRKASDLEQPLSASTQKTFSRA